MSNEIRADAIKVLVFEKSCAYKIIVKQKKLNQNLKVN